MVTKLNCHLMDVPHRSVLAKIFMVKKPFLLSPEVKTRSVLAKIHMVTKPQKYGSTFLNVIEH